MKGSGTHLCSSIANGGMGRRTPLKEAPDETNWFDKTNKVTDKTENTPSIMNLSGQHLLSVESLQQIIETNTICSIQPIRICVVTWELMMESLRTENYTGKYTYARLLCLRERFRTYKFRFQYFGDC